MNRRHFLTSMAASAGAMLLPRVGSASRGEFYACWNAPTVDKVVRPERAVSLKRLIAEAAFGDHPRLGMTRIDGYVTNSNRQDVLLWGRVDPKDPELLFDDLVVAVRSVRGDYDHKTGLVSLDWRDPAAPESPLNDWGPVMAKVGEAMKNGKRDNFRRYDALCREYSNYSRVEGMPPDSQVAKTLLDADYRMKLVSWGGATLPIKGHFKSVFELQLDVIRAAIADTGVNGRHYFSNRNWFEPGRISYLKDEESVFLDCVQVVLRDEEYKAVDENKTPARSFSCAWTNRMDEILRSELIWKQMHGIFRHFALAKVLHEDVAMSILPNRWVLWKDYKLPSVSVPSRYPAYIIHRDLHWHINGKDWSRDSNACGGVKLACSSVQTPAIGDVMHDLNLAREKVLTSSRSCSTSCWNVE
jgi:hypothetical protein